MEFRFSEEQEMLRAKIRRFTEEQLSPVAADIDERDEVSRNPRLVIQR